jgi:hypothetical protein
MIESMNKRFIASLFFALSLFSTLASAADTSDCPTADELDTHLTDATIFSREPASAASVEKPNPTRWNPVFIVTPPERGPASTASKVVRARTARRSHLPPEVINGFELRVQYNGLNSMFWVAEREGHFDLVYANSAGSKSSIGLNASNFSQYLGWANSFKPYEEPLTRCKGASLQLHVLNAKRPEQTTTLCVNSTAPAAKRLIGLSQSLVALVR